MLNPKPNTAKSRFVTSRTAYASFAAVFTIMTACALSLLVPRTTTKDGPGMIFTGKVGDNPALLFLKNGEDARADVSDGWNGHVEVSDEPQFYVKEIDHEAADEVKFLVYHSDEETPYGVWYGQFSPDHLRFDGHWNDGPSGLTVPVCFRAIAYERHVNRTSGLSIAGHGRTASFDGTYPRFLNSTPFDRSVESTIKTVVEQSAKNFARVRLWSDREDLWWTLRNATATNQHDRHDEWNLNHQINITIDVWLPTCS